MKPKEFAIYKIKVRTAVFFIVILIFINIKEDNNILELDTVASLLVFVFIIIMGLFLNRLKHDEDNIFIFNAFRLHSINKKECVAIKPVFLYTKIYYLYTKSQGKYIFVLKYSQYIDILNKKTFDKNLEKEILGNKE